MTQKHQEYYQKWEEVLKSLSLPEKFGKAKMVKKVGVPLIRLIIFYLIVPLLKTGTLPKSCQMVNLCYSAVCRMMKNNRYLWNSLFTAVSYELFFLILADLKSSFDVSYRSRYRIVLAADNSLSPRSNRCRSEGVTKLYDDVTKSYLNSHDVVTIHCIVGDIVIDFPLDMRVWKPKKNPAYKSKIDLLIEMLEALSVAAQERSLSLEDLDLVVDGAYPRGKLPSVVNKLKLRLISKPRSDSSFQITSGKLNGEVVTVKNLKERYENSSLRLSSQVKDNATYERFCARHIATGEASLGEVIIVLVHHQTEEGVLQEVIFTTHLSYTGPIIIKLKERRWTIEVFYRTVKQVCFWTKAQFQTLRAMTAHWTLRCLTYLILAIYRYRYCLRSTTIGQIADRLTIPLREKWKVKL